MARASWCKETTSTTGTGTYSLAGAASGGPFRTFVAGVGNGASNIPYYCSDDDDFEHGYGTITDGSPDTLTRDSVEESSNGDAAVNWGAGTRNIYIGVPVNDPPSTSDNLTWTGTQEYDNTVAFDAAVDFDHDITFKRAFGDVVTLSDGATITWDTDDGPLAKVTIAGNRTLAALSNLTAGWSGVLTVIQDGGGGNTLAFNAAYKFPGSSDPVVASGGGDISAIYMYSYDGSTVICTSALDFG